MMIAVSVPAPSHSPLSQGKAGKIEGGDRLPWVKTRGEDNYAISEQIGWQVHVYGRASTELKGWCDSRGMALREFTWHEEHGRAGPNAVPRRAAALLGFPHGQEIEHVSEMQPKWSRRKEARPLEIVDAAVDVFLENGFAAAKLSDIAKRARVAKGTIYLYFETKEELFRDAARK
ncbi:hypothetical protein G6F65_017198 [Rhizopus arrhizus]|nr:hypothetical protein G6F65_017198 [Rhizopus arrhizus]